MIHMLGRTSKMKMTKSTPALKKNTHTIDVEPSYIGKNRNAHIQTLLDKASTEGNKLIQRAKTTKYTHIYTAQVNKVGMIPKYGVTYLTKQINT